MDCYHSNSEQVHYSERYHPIECINWCPDCGAIQKKECGKWEIPKEANAKKTHKVSRRIYRKP